MATLNSRAGGIAPDPNADPAPRPPAGLLDEMAEVVSSDEEGEAVSTISQDRMYDLYWTHSPTDNVWVIISRREKKKKAKSRMPVRRACGVTHGHTTQNLKPFASTMAAPPLPSSFFCPAAALE